MWGMWGVTTPLLFAQDLTFFQPGLNGSVDFLAGWLLDFCIILRGVVTPNIPTQKYSYKTWNMGLGYRGWSTDVGDVGSDHPSFGSLRI